MNITAELISIGSELLSGRTLNTHGQDLGAALSSIGLQLARDTTVPDDIAIIQGAVQEALARTDLVFVSGGLGPTVDDITRDALAGLLDQAIIPHPPTIEYLRGWYEKRGRKITPAGERQALVLANAAVLPNSVGAAPGQRIDMPKEKTLFVLPGPPNEFNAILNEEILPWLKERYAGARPRPVRIVQTHGIGESDIVTILEAAAFHPAEVDLGFYPGKGQVEIRLTALPGFDQEVERAAATLRALLNDYLDLTSYG
jgi:nicotinamide-nucleotide amidase